MALAGARHRTSVQTGSRSEGESTTHNLALPKTIPRLDIGMNAAGELERSTGVPIAAGADLIPAVAATLPLVPATHTISASVS